MQADTSFPNVAEEMEDGADWSDFITNKFANKKIYGILENVSDIDKANGNLAEIGFGHLQIGSCGLDMVRSTLYDHFKYKNISDLISWGYSSIVGFAGGS